MKRKLARDHRIWDKISWKKHVANSIFFSKRRRLILVQVALEKKMGNRLIECFLDRKQYVCLSGCRSDLKSINYGVAQGSKIGPLLFLIYINDLPNSVYCIPRLFADDTCLLLADANLHSLHENINNELIN